MTSEIYLDNNATTRCDEEVTKEMLPYLNEWYGNPSSSYSFGHERKKDILAARKHVADMLNAREEEILFTSCATESNVTAIMSAIRNFPYKRHIITSSVDHPSVMETMKYLESTGYDVTYLSVDKAGRIDLKELEGAITDQTALIAVMMANNEIGNVYPVKEIAQIARKHQVLFHCDAVQAVGKVKIDVKELGMDTLSISGHKINAPKGIGCLYVKTGTPYIPLIFGHQQNERRGGTENVAYIVGLGKAAEMIICDNYEESARIGKLRDYLEDKVREKLGDIHIYGDLEHRLPTVSSLAVKGVDSNEIASGLERYNIFVSTGSACMTGGTEASYILKACGADVKNYSPMRIGLGKYNTKEEIDIFVEKLTEIVGEIRINGGVKKQQNRL